MHKETAEAATKMAIAGTGATLYSLTLNEWMAVVTIVYVIMQIGLLIPKYWKMWFGKDV